MKLILHILRKDVRHLRWLLVLWFAVILLELTLAGASHPAWVEQLAIQRAMMMVSSLVTWVQGGLVWVIVPFLIHEEPLVGDRAFWSTRPYSRRSLLIAKAMFLLVFLILPPLLSELAVMAGNGVEARFLFAAVPQILLAQGAWVLVAAIFAAMTRSFARFVVLGVAVVVALAFAVGVGSLLIAWMGHGASSHRLAAPNVRWAIQSVLLILCAAGILGNQYLRRQRGLSWILIGVAAVGSLSVQSFWRWNFPVCTASHPKGGEFGSGELNVLFDPSYGWPQPDEHGIAKFDEPTYRLERKLKLTSRVPGYFVEAGWITSSLVFKDATRFDYEGALRGHGYDEEQRALEHALGGLHVLNSPVSRYNDGNLENLVLRVTKDFAEKRGSEKGSFSAKIHLSVFRFQVRGASPLQDRMEFRSGADRVRVETIEKGTRHCELRISQCGPRLFLMPMIIEGDDGSGGTPRFLLRNAARGEAFLPDEHGSLVGFCHKGRLSFQVSSQRFESPNKESWMPNLDSEWLKAAEVIRMDRVKAAEFDCELMNDEFQVMPDMVKFNQHGVPLERLRQIQLPEKPTKLQVKAYIDAILAASESQTKFSKQDLQIEMLKKIGSENVDVLLPYLERQKGNYYPYWTLYGLVGQEHRQMITAGLATHPQWIHVIKNMGWQEDVRDLLIRELKARAVTDGGGPAYDAVWIDCVGMLKDPSTYDDLRQIFIRGPNRNRTYDAVKDLPGFDLQEAVSQAWQAAKRDVTFEAVTMMRKALDFGEKDALDFAFNLLRKSDATSWEAKELLVSLPNLTEATGDREALLRWYQDNKDRIVFDPARKKFITPKLESASSAVTNSVEATSASP